MKWLQFGAGAGVRPLKLILGITQPETVNLTSPVAFENRVWKNVRYSHGISELSGRRDKYLRQLPKFLQCVLTCKQRKNKEDMTVDIPI